MANKNKGNAARKEAESVETIESAPVIETVAPATKGKAKKERHVLTAEQKATIESMTSVSGKIRYLDGQGIDKGDIAELLGKRYQHVRNVLTTPLKRPVAQASAE